jgi:hypothetical protein
MSRLAATAARSVWPVQGSRAAELLAAVAEPAATQAGSGSRRR